MASPEALTTEQYQERVRQEWSDTETVAAWRT